MALGSKGWADLDEPVKLCQAGLDGQRQQRSVELACWALDDIEVDRVEIWRDLVAGETRRHSTHQGIRGMGRCASRTRCSCRGRGPTWRPRTRPMGRSRCMRLPSTRRRMPRREGDHVDHQHGDEAVRGHQHAGPAMRPAIDAPLLRRRRTAVGCSPATAGGSPAATHRAASESAAVMDIALTLTSIPSTLRRLRPGSGFTPIPQRGSVGPARPQENSLYLKAKPLHCRSVWSRR